MKFILHILLSLLCFSVFAQVDSSDKIVFSTYVEAYYLFDFNKPTSNNRPDFVYSHNRHNEFNINLGFIKANYSDDRTRANLAMGVGTYMNANLAAEPDVIKNIVEANVGLKLFNKHNLWLDAGVFHSHIGFESAIGKDNWTLTRSMFADNSPYYESGAKLTYTSKNDKWLMSMLVLNGWQRIQRLAGNSTPSFGHQIQYKPNKKVTLNSSSFIGNDKPDSTKQMRYFHNLYGLIQITSKTSMAVGFDIGFEQKFRGSSSYNTWFTPVGILRHQFNNKHSFTSRVEYYSDENNVIITTNRMRGAQIFGASINYDYKFSKNVMWRIEARNFVAKQELFTIKQGDTNQNFMIATCLAFSF